MFFLYLIPRNQIYRERRMLLRGRMQQQERSQERAGKQTGMEDSGVERGSVSKKCSSGS